MNKKVAFALLPVLFAMLTMLGCETDKVAKIDDSTWHIQVFWQNALQHNIDITFHKGGTLTCTDDTSGNYSGTWSNSDETITWSIDAATRNPDYAATFDKRKIEGTASDDKGDQATMTGDRR